MDEPIHIKPHHFIDIVTALGSGQRKFQPHPYGHAVHAVAEQVMNNPDAALEMDLGADDICAPCIHNVDGLCDDTIDTSYRPGAPSSKLESNLMVDRRWCARLGLAQGDRLTARKFCRLVRDRAADITDIYREIPRERTAERAENLARGVECFLAPSGKKPTHTG